MLAFYSYGADHMTPVLRYGNEWRLHRKLLHISLRPDVVDQYQDLHLRNAYQLLENVRRDSTNYFEHFDMCVLRLPYGCSILMLDSYSGSTALEFTYGHRVDGKDDPIIKLASELAEVMSNGIPHEQVGLLMALPMR